MRLTRRYRDFFVGTFDQERHVILYGGRRSGKTFATFLWLDMVGELGGGADILVVCAEYAPLQRTMEDFAGALGVTPHGSLVHGYTAMTHGCVRWKFAHFASAERAQGTQCDYLFINEAVNVSYSVVAALLPAVRRQAYYNFNPTRKGWLNDFMTEANTLCTTFKDNPHLTAEQLEIFEQYRVRGTSPTATALDRRAYDVYYRGVFSNAIGRIFPPTERISVDLYKQIPAQEVLAIDFGFATDGDPTTLVGVKVHNGRIYVHQYIYEQGLTSDIDLAQRILSFGIDPHRQILADYGGMGAGRIRTLRTADNGKWTGAIAGGFNVCNALKTQIMDGLSQIAGFEGVSVTETSIATLNEIDNYTIDDNGKPAGADHAIDAIRYAVVYARRLL